MEKGKRPGKERQRDAQERDVGESGRVDEGGRRKQQAALGGGEGATSCNTSFRGSVAVCVLARKWTRRAGSSRRTRTRPKKNKTKKNKTNCLSLPFHCPREERDHKEQRGGGQLTSVGVEREGFLLVEFDQQHLLRAAHRFRH